VKALGAHRVSDDGDVDASQDSTDDNANAMSGNLSSIQSSDDKDKSAIDKRSSIRGLGFLLLVASVAFVFA
jgi:hypothetical protein